MSCPFSCPPLRERKDDIPALAEFFLRRHTAINKMGDKKFSNAILRALDVHDWPGNVRELENFVARLVVLSQGPTIETGDAGLPGSGRKPIPPQRFNPGEKTASGLQSLIRQVVRLGIQILPEGTLADRIVGAVERELINQVLEQCDHVQVKAATRLGINRNTLHKKVQEVSRLSEAEAGPAEVEET